MVVAIGCIIVGWVVVVVVFTGKLILLALVYSVHQYTGVVVCCYCRLQGCCRRGVVCDAIYHFVLLLLAVIV